MILGTLKDVKGGGEGWLCRGGVSKVDRDAHQLANYLGDLACNPGNFMGVGLPECGQLGENIYYPLVDDVHHATRVYVGPVGGG